MNKLQDIIIDTDPGCDDAVAIMLAITSKLFNILALTTVFGNTSTQNTTNNAYHILDLLHRTEIPIFSGELKPIAKNNIFEENLHGSSGLGNIRPTKEVPLTYNAPEKIISAIRSSKTGVKIISIAPLSNIAKAIKLDPETLHRVDEIIIMGGAIDIPGNASRVAEFNVFNDPEAAEIVFKSPIKKTLIPLDVCQNIRFFEDDINKIKNKKIKDFLYSILLEYMKNIYKLKGIKGASMCDPLTVYYLINPSAYKTKQCDIVIETQGNFTRGMTVADKRIISDKNCNISLVYDIEGEDFKKDIINLLSFY